MSKYTNMLERSYNQIKQEECCPDSKLEYIANFIFDIWTYENQVCRLISKKMIEVCMAITNSETFKYIENEENNQWYLIMVHMPFIAKKIEWGTSIRGAWWDHKDFVIKSTGIIDDNCDQIYPINFTYDEWIEFILSINEFCQDELE